MGTVALGTMFVVGDDLITSAAARMRCHARALVQDLDSGRHGTDLDQLMHQIVRHAIEIAIKRHVVIDIDAGARPLTQIEGFQRQWLQGRFVESLP